MMLDLDGCLACGHDSTMNGFLCAVCYGQRAHSRHWRWLDLGYLRAVQAEVDGPIQTASAARFTLCQARERN